MTVPELIEDLLRRIRYTEWYHGRVREFARDRRALTKAISRYGYACKAKEWHFQPEDILRDILSVLRSIVETNADIAYFPVYLEGAIDKHIRQRAEELNERAKAAKSTPALTRKIVDAQQVVRILEPTAVELLDKLYRDLKPRRKSAKPVVPKQKELL